MEDKQLDFNRPLLSVRRFSPAVASEKDEKRKIEHSVPSIPQLPYYKSELNSGPIRNPGAVPFVWEQSPGRPKEETKPQTEPLIACHLPPGRSPKASQDAFDQLFSGTNDNGEQAGNVSLDDESISSTRHEEIERLESYEQAVEEKENSDSENGSEAYVDARDTLSKTESFFVNCSISGLSGLSDLDQKACQSFSTDSQTRDFMMDRFLPAAKAVASETPQYAPKKHSVAQEKPRQLKKTVNKNKPPLRYGPSFAKRYTEYHENKEEEEESDDGYDERGNVPAVCGLLPRFCLLNPVPAMSVRTRVPKSRATKMHPRSPSAGSYPQMENEHSVSEIAELKTVQTTKLCVNKMFLNDELRPNNHQGLNLQGSPFCSQQVHSALTHYDVSPQSFAEEKRVLDVPQETKIAGIDVSGLPWGCKTFQERFTDDVISRDLDLRDHAVDKTLHVDSIQKVDFPNIRTCSPNLENTKGFPGLSEKKLEITTKGIDQFHLADPPLKDIKKLDAEDRENLLTGGRRDGKLGKISSARKSYQNERITKIKALGQHQQNSPIENGVAGRENFENLEKQQLTINPLNDSHQSDSPFLAPLPLPKSPSDSWLCRTLPSMSIKSSSKHLYLGVATSPQNRGFRAETGDSKWETIVKSTKVQHQRLHYSEELAPIPET